MQDGGGGTCTQTQRKQRASCGRGGLGLAGSGRGRKRLLTQHRLSASGETEVPEEAGTHAGWCFMARLCLPRGDPTAHAVRASGEVGRVARAEPPSDTPGEQHPGPWGQKLSVQRDGRVPRQSPGLATACTHLLGQTRGLVANTPRTPGPPLSSLQKDPQPQLEPLPPQILLHCPPPQFL